jgi:F-box-like
MALDKLDPAEFLPAEIFQQILSYLDSVDLAKTTEVSKLWYNLGADGVLWQSQCELRWEGKRYMRRVYRIGISDITNRLIL